MSTPSHHSSAEPSSGTAGSSSGGRSQPTQAERTANARKALLSSIGVAAKEVDVNLQTRAETIHSNAHALNKQERELQDNTKRLAKENDEAAKWLEKSSKKLIELDDFGDVDESFDDDLGELEAMLDLLEGKHKPVPESNGESRSH